MDGEKPAEEVAGEPSLLDNLAAVPWYNWLIILLLLCMSGSFSGLNLGVLGLDTKDLEMMSEGPYETKEDEKQGRLARKVLPLRRRGNLLLCTILLGNVMVNSLLSILMADIAGGGIALVSSTALIVVFGEILPQAICSRHGVAAGAYLSWLLWIALVVTFVFSYPIAAILDKTLGEEEGEVMNKTKMKKFFEKQRDIGMIDDDEGRILRAALELQTKEIENVMLPIDNAYMLEINTVINREVTQEIYTAGYSRIPIYEGNKNNIIGVLMTKDLILFNPDRDQLTVKQLSSALRDIVYIDHTESCLLTLKRFKDGDNHLAVVTKVCNDEGVDPYLKKIGLITLEDIIEQILDDKIEDEYEGDGKEERRLQKEQLLALFTNRQAGNNLEENELKAVEEFLSAYVAPFFPDRMRQGVLQALVFNSEVLNIESDTRAFSHKTDEVALFDPQERAQQVKQRKPSKASENAAKESQLLGNQNQTNRGQSADIEANPANINIQLVDIKKDKSEEIEEEAPVPDEGGNGVTPKEPTELEKLNVFNPILYTRGIESDAFHLILSGKVNVCSGNEGFMITQSSFNYLGSEALVRDDYRPDFSAKVVGQARILKINRQQYRMAISSLQQTKLGIRASVTTTKPKMFAGLKPEPALGHP